MSLEHTLIGDVTARKTAEGILILLPPARAVGFEEGSWRFVVKELRWLLLGGPMIVGLWLALSHFIRGQLPASELLISFALWGSFAVLYLGFRFARDALLVRWAPLNIELTRRRLSYDRRLLKRLLRATTVLEVDRIQEFCVDTLPPEPNRHDEPAFLSAEDGDAISYIVAGEHPKSWVNAVAKLLADYINESRHGDERAVRVTCDDEELGNENSS